MYSGRGCAMVEVEVFMETTADLLAREIFFSNQNKIDPFFTEELRSKLFSIAKVLVKTCFRKTITFDKVRDKTRVYDSSCILLGDGVVVRLSDSKMNSSKQILKNLHSLKSCPLFFHRFDDFESIITDFGSIDVEISQIDCKPYTPSENIVSLFEKLFSNSGSYEAKIKNLCEEHSSEESEDQYIIQSILYALKEGLMVENLNPKDLFKVGDRVVCMNVSGYLSF